MIYERHDEPLLPFHQWLVRVAHSIWCAFLIVFCALLIGICGYHFLGGLPWVDAFLEASMILGGMGAVAPMKTDTIKIFAGCYALFSGLLIISVMGIILAPFMHRILHSHFKDKKPKKL